jgi:hypothetical protein
LVWEDTVKKAVELFDDDVGVTIISHHDTVSFIFDDAVLLRFKKADTTLKSSNVQTALSGLFHEHEADLFGYTGLQRVEACYVLNKFETQIVWSGIVARESDANLWHFELTEPTAPATAEVLEFPPMSATDPSDLAKVKESVEKPADEKKDSE